MKPVGVLIVALLTLVACNRDTQDDVEPASVIEKGTPMAGAGLFSSLAVDDSGTPHVAYYHADLHALRYARLARGKWIKETVDGGEKDDRGRNARLALGTKQQVFIAYQDSKGRFVKLAQRKSDGRWTMERVDTANVTTGDFIALGLVEDEPVLAYYEATNGDLMYARRNKDRKWVITAVDQDGDVGRYVALDTAFDGTVHMAYYDGTQGGLKYAVATPTGIRVKSVDGFAAAAGGSADGEVLDPGDRGTWVCIRAQPPGTDDPAKIAPKILYADETNHWLMLAEKKGDGWVRSIVDADGYVGSDGTLLWLANGDLVAAYLDATHLDLRLARRTGDAWNRQTLVSVGAVGLYNSLAALPGPRIALTTYDLTKGSLYYFTLPARP